MVRCIILFSINLLVLSCIAGDSRSTAVFQMRLVADPTNAPVNDLDKMQMVHITGSTGQTNTETLYLEKTVLLNESDLKSANIIAGGASGRPEIAIEFTPEGSKRFAKVTQQNIGKRLAILIDGQLYSAPVIRSEISGGKGVISGNFTEHEARDLSRKLNAALKHKTKGQ